MNRLCSHCGQSAYNFAKCPWCGNSYASLSEEEPAVQADVTEEPEPLKGAWRFLAVLLILLLGPFALGFIGIALHYSNSLFHFLPASLDNFTTALLWAPMLNVLTWPAAALLAAAGILFGLAKRKRSK